MGTTAAWAKDPAERPQSMTEIEDFLRNLVLGKCLAAAVKATRFAPQLKLGLKVEV